MLDELIVATVSVDPPNETTAPLWKPVPLIVTDVPPAAGPAFALTELTVGAATYVKQPVHVPLCVSAFVTTTFTAPAPCEVVVPVMVVAVIPEIVTAAPPNDAVAPAWKPLPLIVTEVPPAAGPLFGVTDVTAGPTTYVKQPVQLALCASVFVTVTFTAPAA
ncbi:MAG TPA: hypothetical protein VIP07_04450 [Candidatus Limnocylindria bacterium]|jgi:hypothetical protein